MIDAVGFQPFLYSIRLDSIRFCSNNSVMFIGSIGIVNNPNINP